MSSAAMARPTSGSGAARSWRWPWEGSAAGEEDDVTTTMEMTTGTTTETTTGTTTETMTITTRRRQKTKTERRLDSKKSCSSPRWYEGWPVKPANDFSTWDIHQIFLNIWSIHQTKVHSMTSSPIAKLNSWSIQQLFNQQELTQQNFIHSNCLS